MTETINLVDRSKFIEKDLPSSGSMIAEIDGWMDGRTRDESKRNWHLEYKMAAWLHKHLGCNLGAMK